MTVAVKLRTKTSTASALLHPLLDSLSHPLRDFFGGVVDDVVVVVFLCRIGDVELFVVVDHVV